MTAKFAIFLVITMGATSSFASASKRTYLVKPNQPHNLTEIKAGNAAGQPHLKDPTLLQKTPTKQKVVVQVQKKPQIVPSKMAFKKVVVNGRKGQPRVAFDRERLDVPMVNEPMPSDFLERTSSDTSLDLLERGGY